MTLSSNNLYDYLPYISESIFEQYLALVEEAIEEDDIATLERFWNSAAKMGVRGRIIQILINEGSNRIVQRVRRDETNLPFYLPIRRGPYNFRLLMQRYNGYRLGQAIRNGNQKRIEELLALDDDLILYDEQEIVTLAVTYKNFPLLERLLQINSGNNYLIWRSFDGIYETHHEYRQAKPLTEAELVSFLVVLTRAMPLIPGHERWIREFIILLDRAAGSAIVKNVDGESLLKQYVAQLTSADKRWLLSLLEDEQIAQGIEEYENTLRSLLSQ